MRGAVSRLSTDRLLEQACASAGLDDFGDLPFLDALQAQLWSLEHESGQPPERLDGLCEGIVRLLVKRLGLVADRKRFPEIAQQRVEAPLIVLGLPRTGSTHLHALLASRPGARAPLQWEMTLPSPPPEAATFDRDPRIAQVQDQLDSRPNARQIKAIHPYGALRPEQCIGLIDWSFVNSTVLALNRMPGYFEWFLGADHRPAYEHHRRTLQHLQWRNPGEWVLKWPKHVFSLDALLATYPDARIVWTHRDPATAVASVASYVGLLRASSSPTYEAVRFGSEWSALEEIGILRAMAARERAADGRRFYDVHYNDLMADPVATVTGIYEHFGVPVTDETIRRVADFQRDNPQNKHGAHSYSAEQFGLDRDRLRSRFAAYIERFGVEPDRP